MLLREGLDSAISAPRPWLRFCSPVTHPWMHLSTCPQCEVQSPAAGRGFSPVCPWPSMRSGLSSHSITGRDSHVQFLSSGFFNLLAPRANEKVGRCKGRALSHTGMCPGAGPGGGVPRRGPGSGESGREGQSLSHALRVRLGQHRAAEQGAGAVTPGEGSRVGLMDGAALRWSEAWGRGEKTGVGGP